MQFYPDLRFDGRIALFIALGILALLLAVYAYIAWRDRAKPPVQRRGAGLFGGFGGYGYSRSNGGTYWMNTPGPLMLFGKKPKDEAEEEPDPRRR